MTELDFDELDKAVNSVMSGVDTSKRKEGFDDPEDTVLEIPTSTDVPSNSLVSPTLPVSPVTTESNAVESPVEDVSSSEVKASEPLAVKRRGQFMDVMHPSSDMKTATAPRREGVSLQPSSPFVAPTQEIAPSTTELTQAPAVEAMTSLDAEPATGSTTPEVPSSTDSNDHVWPDPIDHAQDSDESNNTDADNSITDASIDTPDALPEEVINEVAAPAVEQPITSPFIADAKVDKRPLGTAASFPESVATPEAPLSPPDVAAEPLPEELKTDVLALESSSTAASVKEVEAAPEPSPVAEAAKPSIPGSIPQQYTEQPSTSDASNAAIYDTSTHHQPLDGGVKKSSPMKWVILALVLLIVGALAGAAYFYLKTQ